MIKRKDIDAIMDLHKTISSIVKNSLINLINQEVVAYGGKIITQHHPIVVKNWYMEMTIEQIVLSEDDIKFSCVELTEMRNIDTLPIRALHTICEEIRLWQYT